MWSTSLWLVVSTFSFHNWCHVTRNHMTKHTITVCIIMQKLKVMSHSLFDIILACSLHPPPFLSFPFSPCCPLSSFPPSPPPPLPLPSPPTPFPLFLREVKKQLLLNQSCDVLKLVRYSTRMYTLEVQLIFSFWTLCVCVCVSPIQLSYIHMYVMFNNLRALIHVCMFGWFLGSTLKHVAWNYLLSLSLYTFTCIHHCTNFYCKFKLATIHIVQVHNTTQEHQTSKISHSIHIHVQYTYSTCV